MNLSSFFARGLFLSSFLALPTAQALDLVRTETRVDAAVTKYGVAGRGVIVAVFSRGIDWKNPDFRNADGTTRIDYILDLTDSTGANAPGNTVGAGTLYTRAQINAALSSGSNLNTRDAGGSGSALAGIVAGGGRNNAQFHGIAPEARLIIVKVTADGSPAHDGEAAEAYFAAGSTLVVSAMQFVTTKAAELKLPCVMMLDLGTVGGPMDGTGEVAQKIDRTVGPGIPGLAVVTSSSNQGSVANHATATVTAGGTTTLDIVKVGTGTLRFELWYPETDRFNVRIFTPGITSPVYVAPATPTATDQKNLAEFDYYHRGRDTDFSNSSSAKRQILIDFTGPAGSYKVELTGATVASGRFDATLNVDYANGALTSRFLSFITPGSIWDGGAAHYAITTNSYVGRRSYTDIDGLSRTLYSQGVGELWLGSGVGPTQDGRPGIDVSAPGDSVFTTYAPKSYYATDRSSMIQAGGGFYGRQGGVGGANPIVAGIVALLLELNPSLDAAQIKQILQRSARADSFTGAVPNTTWGYGKIDALGATDSAKSFGLAAKIPGVTIPLLIPAGASAVETRALTEHTNGAVLVAISGAYAVRPNTGPGAQAITLPSYTNPQPYNLSYVVRLLANGQPDPAFTSSPGADGTINAFAVQPADGKIVVAGTFTKFNGTVSKNLARLKADGSGDTTFNTGSGPDAQVNAIALQADGAIVIGGAFQNVQGLARPYLARVSASGAIDAAFSPALNGVVNTLAIQSDGKIVVGGNFTSAGGTARSRLARLLPSGAIDATFDPGAGANGEVVTVAVQANGAVIAGGEFTTFAGQGRGRVVRLLASGALDPAFASSVSANDTVIALGLESSGNVLLGGAFTQVNGTARNRIARLLADGTLDPTFDPGAGANKDVHAILPRSDGTVFVGGLFDQYQGTAVNSVVALTSVVTSTAFIQAPRAITVSVGSTARFYADATGPALAYQWYKDDVAIAGATSASLILTNVATSAQGRYTLKATSGTGSTISADAVLTVSAGAPGQIVNLSVLTALDAPGDTFTLGFVVGGAGTNGAKPLLIRAAGPALSAFGVGNPLADPKLEFYASGTKAGENDNWGGAPALSGLIAQVGAFAYTSASSKDAAFAANPTTASNSVVVSGVGTATGAVIAEVYDASPAASVTAATPRLINVSVLKPIPSGATLTAGFVIGGSTAKTVLIRAVGPTLSTFGVGGPLADPKLTLNQSGVADPIAFNDNWGGSATLKTAMSTVGAFALDPLSKDAAILITLQPGSYTAQANGVGAIAGSALVEVYEVP